jgi:hypothetical protein
MYKILTKPRSGGVFIVSTKIVEWRNRDIVAAKMTAAGITKAGGLRFNL